MKPKIQILVVGGTGFIGFHLINHCLKKKWRVVSFSKNPPKKVRFSSKVKYIKGDLSKKKDLKKMVGDNEREVYNDQISVKRDKRGSLRITRRNQ